MSEVKCPNCKNIQEVRGRFCSQCGYDLSQIQETSLIQTRNVSSQSREEYTALRIVSSMLVIMGWVVMIASVVTSCILFASVTSAGAIMSQGGGTLSSLLGVTGSFFTVFIAAFLFFFGIGFGLAEIAAGQVIMVVINIRDDVRAIANIRTQKPSV